MIALSLNETIDENLQLALLDEDITWSDVSLDVETYNDQYKMLNLLSEIFIFECLESHTQDDGYACICSI